MIKNLKKKYDLKVAKLRKGFLKNHNNKFFLKTHAHLVDTLLRELWCHVGLDHEVSLIGVGGYGREELYPFSDVDILVLHEDNMQKTAFEKVTKFITLCWDLGLKIGHSTRDLNQTIDEFEKDIRTATNLLETRLIIGSSINYENLKKQFLSKLMFQVSMKKN